MTLQLRWVHLSVYNGMNGKPRAKDNAMPDSHVTKTIRSLAID